MKNIQNSRFFRVIYFALLLGGLFSCKNEDVSTSSAVELLSFGPTGTKPGGQIQFIGKNLNKVTAIALKDATVDKAAFISQTDELITITVPLDASEGQVTLKTTEGDVISKTVLSFDVVVKISSFTEEARPGDNITIKGEYLNWVTEVRFAKDTAVTEFVSQKPDELVVKVPFGAETGPLVISAGGTEPEVIETETELKVVLPAITSFAPNPAEKEKNLTIKGTNLDLAKGVLFKGIVTPITEFVSKTPTEIVVQIPKKANKGKVTLVAYSNVLVESSQTLTFVDDLPELDPLKYAMYEDALVNNWQNWGWGNTVDLANNENVRDGEASAKVAFTGSWGAFKFANGSVATATYTELRLSVFGTPGTGGKTINIAANDGKVFTITIKEGAWTEFIVPLSDLGKPATITTLMLQETGWSGTIYLDHVGLR